MTEPPKAPIFPQKCGLTPEQQCKVKAWIKKHGVTKCPAVGSKELAAIEIKKYLAWLGEVSPSWKARAGYTPLKLPVRNEKEQKEHAKQRKREYHRKKREAKKSADLSPQTPVP